MNTLSKIIIAVFVAALSVCIIKAWSDGREQRIRQEVITYRESLGFVGGNGGRLIAVGPFGQIERAESCRFYMNEEGFGPFIADTNLISAFDALRWENARLKKRVEELENPVADGPIYRNPVGHGIVTLQVPGPYYGGELKSGWEFDSKRVATNRVSNSAFSGFIEWPKSFFTP